MPTTAYFGRIFTITESVSDFIKESKNFLKNFLLKDTEKHERSFKKYCFDFYEKKIFIS
jgi:hypothetical protein